MLGAGMSSLAAFGGSYASNELIRDLQEEGDPIRFFGSSDDLLARSIKRIQRVVAEPLRRAEERIRRHFYGYQNDTFELQGLIEEDDFMSIPEMFHLPILQYEPIRKLFDDDRIHGFGYDFIPEGDPYERLIKNGTLEEDAEPDEEGYYTHISIWEDTDPDISFAEIEAIDETRGFIDYLLKNTEYDVTSYPEHRG